MNFQIKLKYRRKWLILLHLLLTISIHGWNGSAQCGKSVTAALALSLIIENAPQEDNLFLALGYTVTSAKNNIFECGGFGVRHYFGPKCTPCKYMGVADALKIKTKTGIKYLVAFGTSTKTANNAWHGWRVAGFLFDEIDRACQESIDEMKQRITAVDNPHIIATQNPNVPSHPIYTFLEELQEKNLVNYSHWILDDNIGLSIEKINEVKSRYSPDSIYYRRYINGERVNPEGAIFTVNEDNIIHGHDKLKYQRYVVCADKGENKSATVFLAGALKFNEELQQLELHILKQYHHLNDRCPEPQKKSPQQYADDYAEFIRICHIEFGRAPEAILFDGTRVFYSDLTKSLALRELAGTVPKYVVKDEIEERIITLQNYLFAKKVRIDDSCKVCIQDLKNALYDEKKYASTCKLARLEDYTTTGHSDTIDAIDYICTYYKKYLSAAYRN